MDSVKTLIEEIMTTRPKTKNDAIETFEKIESLISAWVVSDLSTGDKKAVLNIIWK
jgi:hypothetical protein